jgi:diguanylate cyclase (GGDEF)-like protein
MTAAELLAALRRTVEQLAALNELAKALTSTLETREVLALVMQKVSSLLRPANWSLLLHDDATDTLYFEIAVGVGATRLKSERISVGEGIAGTAFRSGRPRLVDDVRSAPDFSPRFDTMTDFRTGSVLAVPLVYRGRALGVIELVNGEGDPRFGEEDLAAVMAIADFAAIAIQNARDFQRVQELTLVDEHTGLGNMRALRKQLDAEVTRARSLGHPLSLLFLDLDHFKQVNDNHGHLVGSAVLREVGTLLCEELRPVDSAFRFGGDEFAVLLVEADIPRAVAMTERLLVRFRAHRFQATDGLDLRITASMGIAACPEHAAAGVALIEAADRAMYLVKARGRDGLAVAGAAS